MDPQQPQNPQYPGYPQQGQAGPQQGYGAPQQGHGAPQQQYAAPQQPPKKKGGKLKYVLMGCLVVVVAIPCVLFGGWVAYVKLVANPAPDSNIAELWDKYGNELQLAAKMAAEECRGYDDNLTESRPAILPQGGTPLGRPIAGVDEAARLRADPRLSRDRTVCGIDKIAGWSNGSYSIRGWSFGSTRGGREGSVSNTWELEQRPGVVHGEWNPDAGLLPFLTNYENTPVLRWFKVDGRTFVVIIVPHQTGGTRGLGMGSATIHTEFTL